LRQHGRRNLQVFDTSGEKDTGLLDLINGIFGRKNGPARRAVFDVAILCGSEGTLAMIAEAELNLLPIPAHAALINIRYG
ncbi:hypothetical protein AB9E35_34345, partial [Rhizobium leguminosarum]